MEIELNELFANDEKRIIEDALADNQKRLNIRIVLVITFIILIFVWMGRMGGYLTKSDIISSFYFFILMSLVTIIPISRKQSVVIKKLYNEIKRINGEETAKSYLKDCANSRGKQDTSVRTIAVGVIVGISLILVAAFFLQMDYFGTEEMCTENFIRNMKW